MIASQWKSLVHSANEAFSRDDLDAALPPYYQALSLVQSHFEKMLGVDPDEAITSMVISFLNIADTYKAMRCYQVAAMYYNKCFSFLNQQLQRCDLTDVGHAAILRAYNASRIDWYNTSKYMARYPVNQLSIDAVNALLLDQSAKH